MRYSFLICAYNAEPYLKDCLESIVNQEFDKKHFEIILINDGSTDNTEKIANAYRDVKVINQSNMGLPGARNTALDKSSGNWIIFVDADDYISNNYLTEIDQIVSSNQNINFIKIWEKKESKANKKDIKVQSHKMDDSIVSRVVNRNIFKDYRFPEKYKFAIEDWDFYVHNLHKLIIKDLSDDKNVYYFYRFNKNSLSKTNNIYKSRFEHALSIFEDEKLRRQNLEQGILGHYWEHLYMVARLWHKDLMPRVKSCRYKTKIRWAIRLQYWIVKLGLFNWLIKRAGKPVNK